MKLQHSQQSSSCCSNETSTKRARASRKESNIMVNTIKVAISLNGLYKNNPIESVQKEPNASKQKCKAD